MWGTETDREMLRGGLGALNQQPSQFHARVFFERVFRSLVERAMLALFEQVALADASAGGVQLA